MRVGKTGLHPKGLKMDGESMSVSKRIVTVLREARLGRRADVEAGWSWKRAKTIGPTFRV